MKTTQVFGVNLDSNAVGFFPLAVKRRLVQDVTQVISTSSALLTSPSHVNWAMQVLGQSFSLPVEDHVIIKETLNVYSIWLLKPDARPTAIQETKDDQIYQLFIQNIIQHLSSTFDKKDRGIQMSIPEDTLNNKDYIAIQAELCKIVLKIISLASKTLGHTYSKETWTIILKVLIGIADYIISQDFNQDPNSERMCMLLCSDIFKVVFEIWMRSKTVDVLMWDYLKVFAINLEIIWKLDLES